MTFRVGTQGCHGQKESRDHIKSFLLGLWKKEVGDRAKEESQTDEAPSHLF